VQGGLARQHAVQAVGDIGHRGENLPPLGLAKTSEHMVDDPTSHFIVN
jgi:hypothetical protein